jgi:integrase
LTSPHRSSQRDADASFDARLLEERFGAIGTIAGVVDEGTTHGKKMHGARYTSGMEFYLATGDIYATQQLLGHADVSTTANIYVQGSPADLEAKLRKVWGE